MSSDGLTRHILRILIGISLLGGIILTAMGEFSLSDFLMNLMSELIGAAIAFYALNVLIDRKKNEENKEEKRQFLVRLARSGISAAKLAIEELNHEGWLTDGALRGANFDNAQLQNLDLSYAKLTGAIFTDAQLQNTQFPNAKLDEAGFGNAKLNGAVMAWSDLQGAFMQMADLTDACLQNADLRGADLIFARLQGADLLDAALENAKVAFLEMDETTILPDGSRGSTDDGTLDKFIDRSHPDFWEPRRFMARKPQK